MNTIKIFCLYSFILSVVLSSFGCSGKHDPPAKMVFAKKAVTIHYKADKSLNLVENSPHSLLLIVYQLSNPNAYNSKAEYREGLVTLLEGKPFDPSVVAVNKKYIEPGSSGTLTFDRAEQAKHVAFVAGFDSLIPEKCTMLVDITTTTSRHGILLTKETKVNPLDVDLVLQKDSMRMKKVDDDS